jgi:peptidoglycan/LPS O-acetylase OafA/YrhL
LQSSLRYNPAFDGLRAIAVTLVVADHCRVPGFNPGFFGVDLFFVLSGFLITRLLTEEIDAEGRINLPHFYLRRVLRLGPPLLLLLMAYLAFAPSAWPQWSLKEHFRDAALAGFYLSDYARAFWGIPRVLQHSWSLSVEEHFYLIWPLALLLLARCKPGRRVPILLGLFLLATAWRIFEYYHAGWTATYYRFDTRMSGLIAGALLATCMTRMNPVSERTANIIGVAAYGALILCLSIGYWRSPWVLIWMTTLAELAAVGFLIAASTPKSWARSILSARPLVGLGVISYGVYLWHYPVAVYFRDWLPWHQTVLIAALSAIAIATASYLTIERPLQRYRRNLGTRAKDRAPGTNAKDRALMPAAEVVPTAS